MTVANIATQTVEVIIAHCYIQRGVASAWVTTPEGQVHRVAHTAYKNWFCTCPRGSRCPQIKAAKLHLPVEALETGAKNVRDGVVSPGVCQQPRFPRETPPMPITTAEEDTAA